ncbi:hypothetical protein [Parvibaculum sp.]|uniref:hypothetical protein n=1 Tax=Parvibaculum sp. TaxID=2024848 RepID=UPI002631B203|nr:hypothetical protein [Parvibaculum sp.]MCW5728154.1 hypothetical protein [Parvibaculum sp.]
MLLPLPDHASRPLVMRRAHVLDANRLGIAVALENTNLAGREFLDDAIVCH